MDTNSALTIIGCVLSIVGIIFIVIPKVVNEKTMNDLPEEAVNISALFRSANGGLGLALGMIAVYCRKLPTESAETVLLSMGTGFILVNLSLLSGKFRGYGNELPVPPMIIFLVLTIIAYYAALG